LDADLERARAVAVALEQELARVRELAATVADRWAEIAEGMRVLAAVAEPDDLIGHIRADRARLLHGAARDLRWVLANDTIPHWLMTNEELGEPESEPAGGAS
jgi:hypothetical protein